MGTHFGRVGPLRDLTGMGLSLVRFLAAALLASLPLRPAMAQDAPARLSLMLKPIARAGRMDRVEVEMRIEAPAVAAGQPLVRLPLTIVSIPTSAYEASQIQASDGAGPLPLSQREEAARPEGVYRQYLPVRATEGDVTLRYTARPRPVTARTNNGPLFDMREENGGFTAAGISFLAVPPGEKPYRISLRWDLSDMPAGSVGLWSLGEGDVETIAPAQQLAFTFYGAGPFRAYQARPGDRLTLYALSPAPFDLQALAGRVGRLYDHMAGFFGDREGAYRVFARQHPYRGRGGTALPRSFMFGYHAQSDPTVDQLHGMLSHEIAHGWPSLQGEHGETAWYSEGMAEYYSILLSRRSGVLDDASFLDELNRRAATYFSHSFRGLTNEEAAARFWSDPFVQQVPYGRGFLYLARTDAAIRAASGGRRSLDDLVLAMRARQAGGQPYGNEDWLALVGAEIGQEKARREYLAMTSGEIVRPANAFGPCFLAVPAEDSRFELGFARRSLNDGVVRELVPGSAAARAGVKDGDRILDYSELEALTRGGEEEMDLQVERGGQRRTIRYRPRAEKVEAYRFVRDPRRAEDACRL